MTPEEKADQMLKEVEISKERILPKAGKNFSHSPDNNQLISKLSMAVIDETYFIVGSHLDSQIIDCIQRGDYIDFSKLIPKDKIMMEEDQRLEMIIRNGRMYYIPVTESMNITNFQRWEQAFRVYANVYAKTQPQRSSELIEYNQLIHTASINFIWENVYLYDKDFRLHMARNPDRNWGIILQQAWSLCLKDRISPSASVSSNQHAQQNGNNGDKVREPCKRYNKGRCSFGTTCRYEHRCSYCFKFGHTVLNCRKLAADREWSNKRRESNGSFGYHNHSGSAQTNKTKDLNHQHHWGN